MSDPPDERRGELFRDEMMRMPVHDGWADGRTGFVFCRLDAVICENRLLRAELTWADDAESGDRLEPTSYYNPLLTLESNRIDPRDHSRWVTHDAVHIDISGDLAAELAGKPPADLLSMFGPEISSLRLWEGAKCV